MDRLTLVETFTKLFEYLGKNPLFILIFAIFILVYFYLILSPVYTKKHKIIYTIFFLVAIVSLIIIYGATFWKFLDYLIDNIFVALFFPSLPIYMVMIVTTIIIFIATMFKENISSGLKKLNTFAFLLIMFFLILSLNIVMTKNVNVYSQLAIYSNEYLLVMIQMTMNTFAIWILVLGIIKIIHIATKKTNFEDEPVKESVINNTNENLANISSNSMQTPVATETNNNIVNNNVEEHNNDQYTTLQEFVPIVDTPIHPYINSNSEVPNESVVDNSTINNLNKDEISQAPGPSQQEDSNNFTSDEYKILHQYLQDIKNQQDNNGNTN